MAGCIKPIPVFVKQPEITAMGIWNSNVDDSFKLENPMDLKERCLGIPQMLQNMVEPNYIKKVVRESGIDTGRNLHHTPRPRTSHLHGKVRPL